MILRLYLTRGELLQGDPTTIAILRANHLQPRGPKNLIPQTDGVDG